MNIHPLKGKGVSLDKRRTLYVGWSMNPARKKTVSKIEEARALATTISEARSRATLAQVPFAQRIHTTHGNAAKLEGRRTPPSTHTLEKFASEVGARLAISFKLLGTKQRKAKSCSAQSRANKGSCVGN